MTKWLAWLFLLCASMAHAGQTEEGAMDAFRAIQALPHHEIWEYGGVIVERYGLVVHSPVPATDQKEDSVLIDVRTLMLPSDRLLGLYHTHPCLPAYYSSYFSVNDIIQQDYWGVPTFMLDQCKGEVHEFQLGVDHVFDTGRTVRLDNGKRIHLPAGRIIGTLWHKQGKARSSKSSSATPSPSP